MKALTNILIVDDEQMIRDGLKNMLDWEQAGFRIVGEAPNGRAALGVVEELKPQIVITDLKMPEMDGLELTKQLAHRHPEIQFLVLSSYDDFEFVSQSFRNGAVDYLLKPTVKPANLLPILNKMKARLKTTTSEGDEKSHLTQGLNRILAGYGEAAWQDFQEYFGKGSQLTFLYCKNSWTSDATGLKHGLSKLMTDQPKVKGLPFEMTKGDFGLLIGYQEAEDLAALMQGLKELVAYDEKAFIVIGQPFTSFSETVANYQKLVKSSQGQAFYFKGQKLMPLENLYQLDSGTNFDTKKFIRALLDNDFLLGLQRIEEFIDQLVLAFPDPVFLKQQTSSIFYTMIVSLEDAFPEKSVFVQVKQRFFSKLNDASSLEDFSKEVITTLNLLRGELETASSFKTEDELLRDIQRYINDNFRENLSLGRLAEHFHFSYNYLSSFFSATFNQTFTEYLNQVRLKEAKRLLIYSQANLSEIADACGYSDLSYFSKLFKKEFGTTPSKYRRENRL